MKGENMLMGLSYIDPKFVEESEKDTICEKGGKYVKVKPETSRRISRPVLLAAVIALLLVLVGCAVVCVSALFGSPKEMISALYGENAGFASSPPTDVTVPWKPDSVWTMPGYEKQPVEETVSQELEKWVTPVGQSIASGGNRLTVDAFLYDNVTQSGLITMLLEHSQAIDPMVGYDGEISAYLADINQFGRAYLIPEKTTDTQLAFTYYFHMDKRSGDNLSVSLPDYEENAKSEALEKLREEEVSKNRQRLKEELTVQEAAQKCQELYGFSGMKGEYDDYYFLAASEFDTAHQEDYSTQYGKDLAAIEESLKKGMTPEEAIAKVKELWGEDLFEETMAGREQEEIESLVYNVLANRTYDETHTENKIFVPLPEDMALPNKTFGDGAVLLNSLCVRISSSLYEKEGGPSKLIIHMKDGTSFIILDEVTENTLYNLVVEHEDILYMLNSAINLDNVKSVEVMNGATSVTLEADTP